MDEKFRQTQPSLMDYLSANGFDPLGHSNASPERSATVALDEGQRSFYFPSMANLSSYM